MTCMRALLASALVLALGAGVGAGGAAAQTLGAGTPPVAVPLAQAQVGASVPPLGAGGTSAAPANAAPQEPELSLPELIKAALENNRNIGIARRGVGIAEDLKRQADARYYPLVTFDASTAQRDVPPSTNLLFGGTTFHISQGDLYTTTTRTALVLPLFDFGRSSNAVKAANLGVEQAQLASQRTDQDLALAVSDAYYGVLQAEKTRGVVVDSIATVQTELNDAKAFLSQGLVAASDVLAVEVRLAERQQALIQAEVNLQVAMASLDRVVGWDVNRKLRLKDVVAPVNWQANYASLVRTAQENRSDLKASKLQVQSAEANVRAGRAELFPRINGFAEYDTNSTSFLEHKEFTMTGFTVSMNLFTGGAATAELERRQKQLLDAQDSYLEQQDNVTLAVKQAYLTAEQSVNLVSVSRQSVDLAAENLRILRDRYAQGLVTITDVLNAEESLARARSNFYNSLYSYHAALARLDNVVGKTQSP